jgi:mRNA-degrading endonuclease RelE of RelBE toxin-antitoxin system
MPYNIVFSPEAQKYLAALDHSNYSCIEESIMEIMKDPYSHRPKADIMKIGSCNAHPIYRLRVGRHRLEYSVDEAAKNILLNKAIDLKVEIINPDDDIGFDLKPKTLDPKSLGWAETLNPNDESIGFGSKSESLNLNVLEEAVKGANSNRQTVAIWSPEISAVLWYLKKTIPEFSISEMARSLLEKKLQIAYPELYTLVKEEMSKES